MLEFEDLPRMQSLTPEPDISDIGSPLSPPSILFIKENTGCKSISQEMDLIEVLWKQDVDLGFTLTPPAPAHNAVAAKTETPEDLEKLKVLLEIKNDKNDEKKKKEEEDEVPLEDPWAGLSYTIDTETGEYVLNSTDGEAELPPPLADLFLEEALQLPELVDEESDTSDEEKKNLEVEKIEEELKTSVDKKCQQKKDNPDNLDETDEIEDLLCDMMIQSSTPHFQHPRQPTQSYGHGINSLRQGGYHHHHHHHHQSRVPMSRAVSMEQRWQDLANLLSFPPGMGVGMGVGEMPPSHPHHPHYPTHYPYQTPQHGQFGHHPHPVLHNASLADIAPSQPHYGPNLGSAVSTSMHLTNSTSETDAGATGYKMDHDMMYYSNASTEMNHSDGFLNSILNDEDLQLMDMAVNEGMYTMRMLDHNATSNNSSVLGGVAGLNNSTNNVSMINANPMQTSLNGTIGLSNGVHGTGDRLDASSDSAVSSMGSERVPSLSDGEWGDNGSDSAQEYHQSKYGGPFDYSYNSSRLGDGSRQPPVAQKKHHMFAKRYFQEQNITIPALPQPTQPNPPPTASINDHIPTSIKYEYDYMTPTSIAHQNLEGAVGPLAITKQEEQSIPQHPLVAPDMKYPYSLDFRQPRSSHHDIISHNHTYTLPHSSGANPKPQTRDKKMKRTEEEHLTRDEKRARAIQIPISVQDIINLPMDEFNERLSKYDLSETQLSLIRDIRRRGKNKVAAQNCRKRKLDQIITLADEVKDMKMRKERLLREREHVLSERKKVKDKFTALYRHVFQNLRDPEGNPYSQYQYSLQQSADGSVVLVPRTVENQHDVSGGSMNQQQNHTHHNQQHPHNQHNNSHHHNQHRPKE